MARAVANQPVDMRSGLDVVDSAETFQQLVEASASGLHQYFEVPGGYGLALDVVLDMDDSLGGSARFRTITLREDAFDESSPILWQLTQVPLVVEFEIDNLVLNPDFSGSVELSILIPDLATIHAEAGFEDAFDGSTYYLVGDPDVTYLPGADGYDESFVPYALRQSDTITGSAGDDYLVGFAGNDTIRGSGGADTLKGDKGNDQLAGGKGKDKLSGGGGADAFVFDTALNATTNKDAILDFAAGSDRIQLDDDVFTALGSGGARALKATNFQVGAADDANDYILYNPGTGVLFYDADGDGPGEKIAFAVVGTATHPALTAASFQIVA